MHCETRSIAPVAVRPLPGPARRSGSGAGAATLIIVVADLVTRPQPVSERRGGEGLAGLLLLRADDHRAKHAGEELDFEQLLNAPRELEQAGDAPVAQVHHGHAA